MMQDTSELLHRYPSAEALAALSSLVVFAALVPVSISLTLTSSSSFELSFELSSFELERL